MSKKAVTSKEVLNKLEAVIDPELGVDVVNLGFIYDVSVEGNKINVKYTLTTPGCPMASFLSRQIEIALEDLVEDSSNLTLELVFDPPWTPEMMSDQAKETLEYEG